MKCSHTITIRRNGQEIKTLRWNGGAYRIGRCPNECPIDLGPRCADYQITYSNDFSDDRYAWDLFTDFKTSKSYAPFPHPYTEFMNKRVWFEIQGVTICLCVVTKYQIEDPSHCFQIGNLDVSRAKACPNCGSYRFDGASYVDGKMFCCNKCE